MGRQADRWTDGWMDGRTDGWTDGLTDGQTDRQIDLVVSGNHMYINTQYTYIYDHFSSVQLKVFRERDRDTHRDTERQTNRDTSHCVNRRFMSKVRKISGQKCKQAAS